MDIMDPTEGSHRNHLKALIIAFASIAAALASYYHPFSGPFVVFQNLFYVPIILSCIFYEKIGFIYSLCLTTLYVVILLFSIPEKNVSAQVFEKAGLFVTIAWIVSFLSIRHKRAERRLRESAETFRRLFEDSTDPVLLLNKETFVDCNQACVVTLGYGSKDEVRKRRPEDLSPQFQPDGRPSAEKAVEMMEMAARNGHHRFEWVHLKADGSEFPVEVMLTPVVIRNKEFLHVVWRDIAERKKYEEALSASSLRLSEAMDLAHVVYWEFDPATDTYTFNDPFYALYGTTAEREGGYNMTKDEYAKRFKLPEDHARYYQFVEESYLKPSSEIGDIERRIVRRDGEVRHILTRARTVKDGAGRIIKRYGANQDISELKQMEKVVRESGEQFRKIFEESPIGMVTASADFRFIKVNAAFCAMLGYTEEELSSLTFKDITHPEHVAGDALHVNDLLNGKIALYRTEKRYIRKDNGIIWASVTVNIMRDSEGRFLHFFTTIEDITDRKQAEESLRESEQMLQALMNAAPVAITWSDMDGNRKYMNRKHYELFGYTLEEIPTKAEFHRRAYPDPAYRKTIPSFTEAYRQGKDLTPYEATVTCKDGGKRNVIVSATAVHNMLLLMFDDITERKQIALQLLQSQKMEAIGTLAGGVAHDFNNILTAIIGFANILQMDMDKDDPKTAYLEQILASSQRAANLTQSLLAFSRKQQIDLKVHEMNNIVEQTTKLLKRLLTEDIDLKVTLTPANPSFMADAVQMDQILINLATNARDAMPKGGTLRIKTGTATMDDAFIKEHGYGKPGEYATLSVSDTGVGMDEKTKQHIFEPFFTTKEVGKGTGLGLSTVYGAVKQHNGYITVDSEPHKGTLFRLWFALVHPREQETVLEPEDAKKGTETILVAEDDPRVRRLMKDILGRYGYTVLEAADGEEALRLFMDERDKIGLVICDVVMPRMNGKEVCEEIKKSLPDMKVLFTSGYTKDVIIEKGLEDAMVDFIMKPIHAKDFLIKVREVLDR